MFPPLTGQSKGSARHRNAADVLLVDDDAGFLELCAMTLRHDGYVVVTADSARTAITWLGNCLPKAMLLDWKLSDGSGLDVLQWAFSRGCFVPTALVTEFWLDPAFESAEAEARRLGVQECVRRGLDLDCPTELLRRLLDPLGTLHDALMSGDAMARDVIVVELSRRVMPRLRSRFRQADDDLIEGAVLDATAAYVSEPSRFKPGRHVSVEHFTYMSARRIVWNALRSERRRRAREEEYVRLRGEIAEAECADMAHGRAIIEQALAIQPDLAVRTAIRKWLEGERGTTPWLTVPAVAGLGAREQRAEIERRKDAFRARVKRLALQRRRQ